MTTKCISVFTAESLELIQRQGGSRSWRLDPNRARSFPYLVCVQNQNQNNIDRKHNDPVEAQYAAFLIGKISNIIPSPDYDADARRWQICVKEFCRIRILGAWKGWQNPVHYSTLEEMGIKPCDLRFEIISKAKNENFANKPIP